MMTNPIGCSTVDCRTNPSVIYQANSIMNHTEFIKSLLKEQPNLYYFEIWVSIDMIIDGFKSHYYISSYGRVFSTYSKKLLSFSVSEGGYLRVSMAMLNGKFNCILLHRLVMLAFNYDPMYDLYEVNHKDGIKANNYIWNLEWSTRLENAQHAAVNGLYLKGTDNPLSIYTNEQVHLICQGLQEGLSHKDIAKKAGIEYNDSIRSSIVQIKAGTSWSHISCNYTFQQEPSYQMFSNAQVHSICQNIKNGITDNKQLVINSGVDFDSLTKSQQVAYRTCVSGIKLSKRFVNISKNYF